MAGALHFQTGVSASNLQASFPHTQDHLSYSLALPFPSLITVQTLALWGNFGIQYQTNLATEPSSF